MPLGSTLKNQKTPRSSNGDFASIVRARERIFPAAATEIPMRVAREFCSEMPVNAGLDRFALQQKGQNSQICPVNSRNTPIFEAETGSYLTAPTAIHTCNILK
jgi:hypothetical protein